METKVYEMNLFVLIYGLKHFHLFQFNCFQERCHEMKPRVNFLLLFPELIILFKGTVYFFSFFFIQPVIKQIRVTQRHQ